MRFLVVDGERAGGVALGRALERLGHAALVVSYIGEHPGSHDVDSIDAVLLAIEARAISGLELAHEIALRAPGVAIGFLAGDVTDRALLALAAQVGPVLPSTWVDADVVVAVDRLAAAHHLDESCRARMSV